MDYSQFFSSLLVGENPDHVFPSFVTKQLHSHGYARIIFQRERVPVSDDLSVRLDA